MSDEKELVLEAKHITRRFHAAGGKMLTACNDESLNLYRGRTLGLVGEAYLLQQVYRCAEACV